MKSHSVETLLHVLNPKSNQIINFLPHPLDKSSRHMTEVKMLLFFGLLHHDSIGLWLAQVSGIPLNILQRNVGVKSVGTNIGTLRRRITVSI